MKPQQARVYLEGVVLGLVRADLEQPSTRKDSRKLSPHLYEALKRALYKPAAFFKAIVFPLLDVSGLDGSIFLRLILVVDRHLAMRFREGAHSRRPPSSRPYLPKSKCRFCIPQLRSSASRGWTTPVRNSFFLLLPSSHDSCTCACARTRVDRPHLTLHPRLTGQETRATVQGARRPRVPLYPAQQYTRTRHAARPLASELARTLPALRGAPRARTKGRAERRRACAPARTDLT
jgi:hypothetical protein